MPEGTKAYDYTYDFTAEANTYQSTITFTSVRLTLRNYDRQYVGLQCGGSFNKDCTKTSSFTVLPSNYISSTVELMDSIVAGAARVFFSVCPTVGLVCNVQQNIEMSDGGFGFGAAFICPLSASITLNTSLLKRKETNGQAIKTATAANAQSSLVKYKLIEISEATNGEWIGSINFVQDQLGVFVILSVGIPTNTAHTTNDSLEAAISNIPLPISLNTRLEVYKLIKANIAYIIGCGGDGMYLELYNDEDNGLRLRIQNLSDYIGGVGFCIRGFIPGAYLHTEDQPPVEPAAEVPMS